MSQCWRRISLKADVVRQSYGNVYGVIVFSWTRCRRPVALVDKPRDAYANVVYS